MKSSKANRQSQASESLLSNNPIYSLLAIYMPLSLLAALAFLLSEIMPYAFSWRFPIISGIVCAIAASFYCDFMKDDKTSRIAANIRGIIIITALSYLVSSLFSNEVLSMRFFPGAANISASLGALYAWSEVVSLKQLFKDRKQFDEYTELYQGEKLREALSENFSLLQESDEKIVKTRRNYLLQLILIGLFLLIATVQGNHISSVLYIMMIFILAAGVCITGFLGIFREEHYYAAEGLVFPRFDRLKRMLAMGVFTVLCIGGAILLSSDKSILNISLITDFLKWFFGLFKRSAAVPAEMHMPEITPMTMNMETPSFPVPDEPYKPWAIWKWIKYFAIVLAAAAFVWFMISPLLNRGKAEGKLTVRRRLYRIIAEWFKGLLSAIASLFTFLQSGSSRKKLHKPKAADIRRTSEAVFGAYSHAKRKDIRQSVTLFARLILWGEDARQVSWKPSHAPGEYCGLLAAAAESSYNEGILRCGELFEQALYSEDVLSDTERKEFRDLIKEITGS